MTYKEYIFLKSDENEVLKILEGISEDNWISRMSFERRLEAIRAKLEGVEPPKPPVTATLTFRGDPVEGSESIAAGFGSKVSDHFNTAITAIAAGIDERLGYMGIIPGKQENQLRITGTAVGSFGFQYEVPTSKDTNKSSVSEEALKILIKICEASVMEDDQQLSELINQIHPRALKKVAWLLEFTAKQKAYLGIGVGSNRYQFADLETLKKASARVQSDHIKRGEESFRGELAGTLPDSREFELNLTEEKKVIKGKIGAEIDDPEKLYPYLKRAISVTLDYYQVGQTRPRYILSGLDKIKPIETS